MLRSRLPSRAWRRANACSCRAITWTNSPLREIGRTQSEHESTVSRQLDRVRRELREAVTQALLRGVPARDGHGPEPGLDEAQVEWRSNTRFRTGRLICRARFRKGKPRLTPGEVKQTGEDDPCKILILGRSR